MSKVRKYPEALHDRVIVSEEKPELMTAGGIILPESLAERQCEGTVVSMGPWVNRDTAGKKLITLGCTVRFPDYAGTTIDHNDKQYLVMRESDIFFVV